MADAQTNGDGTRLQKIARSEVAAGWQRIIVIVGAGLGGPALLAVLGWIALTLVGIDGHFARVEGKVDLVSTKMDGVDQRVDRLENWRDSFPAMRQR